MTILTSLSHQIDSDLATEQECTGIDLTDVIETKVNILLTLLHKTCHSYKDETLRKWTMPIVRFSSELLERGLAESVIKLTSRLCQPCDSGKRKRAIPVLSSMHTQILSSLLHKTTALIKTGNSSLKYDNVDSAWAYYAEANGLLSALIIDKTSMLVATKRGETSDTQPVPKKNRTLSFFPEPEQDEMPFLINGEGSDYQIQ